jgi:hypothetical protein
MNPPHSPALRNAPGPRAAARAAASPPVRNSKVRRLVALGLTLVVAALGWSFWPDRHLAAVKALRSELFSPEGRQLSQDERRQKFEQLREEEKQLSTSQRRGLRAEGMRRRAAEINRYFHLPKEEKTKYLDGVIAREESRRKEWQARMAAGGGGPAGGPAGGPQGGPRGANRPGGLGDVADRDKRRSDFLDSMTAAQRGEFNEFGKELNARRQQLGLPPNGRR